MIQWFLDKTVKIAQYGQGIGAASRADRAVLQRLKPRVIFDVGANRGQYLALVLKHSSAIHAFEPSGTAFAELSSRFGTTGDVFLNNLALGAQPGERSLYYDVPGSELSSLYPRKIDHHGIRMTGQETVRVETLDSYCSNRGVEHIDLLKLDVEGHELEVLRGATQMFDRQQIAAVTFEFGGCNVDARTFLRDFFEFFEDRNMRLSRVTAFGGLRPLRRYSEGLEQFRTTCFVACILEGSPNVNRTTDR